jgi:hypothetical protein
VEPLELDTAIEELETRVERLRALYEQFFMGFEKIPPAVVHKDVERRIYTLRREQIRNTAKRFKLQTIIQRYNTFHQYWQRILREIENGTYRRHVLKAERSASLARASKVPSAIASDTGMQEAAPDSENAPSSRARKSISPSSPRHSLSASPRHSTMPPPEKIEAFTRALERDLAAALDGDLDFGHSSSGLGADSLDLDEKSPHPERPRKPPPRSPVSQVQENLPATATGRHEGLPTGHLRLPAQSAVGGHGLPPPKPKLPARAVNEAPPATPIARPAAEPRPAQASNPGLSADRVSQLHRDLLEAKAKTSDAGTVSLNALSRKLEATVKQLSEKHAGKRIDFAVVIKDGKAVVKPIVR